MTAVGRIFGEVLGGKAFGDWSLRPEEGRAFTEADIALYHAPRTMAGKDRSILLEVYDWPRDREDCGFIILGSGDSDYQVLVDRARARVAGSYCAPSARPWVVRCSPPRRCFRWRPSWASIWPNTAM